MSRVYIADKETLDSVHEQTTQILAGIGSMSSGGIAPSNMIVFRAVPSVTSVKLYISGPEDTVIDGQTVCTVKGVLIKRSTVGYPETEQDGDLVMDLPLEDFDTYKTSPYVDANLINETQYYYAAFPYSDYGIYNRNEKNRSAAMPRNVIIYGFHQCFTTLDPESCITYTDDNVDFTPMQLNTTTGEMTMNSWSDFPIIVENKPYMVHSSNAEADYQLDETNYAKKADGVTNSDASNTSYAGGCFSWLKKVYMKETYDADGNGRLVQFAFSNETAETADFKPIGFVNESSEELEGLWLPMAYMDLNGRMIFGGQPVHTKTTDQEYTMIQSFSSKATFLGGAIMNVLRDLKMLWSKSTNDQAHFGEGCMSSYVNSSPYYGVKTNAIVAGGKFYGTSGGTNLNKFLHSLVMQSFQQLTRDPFTLLSSGQMLVSTKYAYSLTGVGYKATGKTFSTSSAWRYASKLQYIEDFGSIAQYDNLGTTSTGMCDGQYYNASGVRVGRRLGACNDGLADGGGCLSLNYEASNAYWACGLGVLLKPSAGYSPE